MDALLDRAPRSAQAGLLGTQRSARAVDQLEASRLLDGATIPNQAGKRWPADIRWPLLVVLAAQAALSLRLVFSNTAFQDEGLYLRAGHLEWARWLHGTPQPADTSPQPDTEEMSACSSTTLGAVPHTRREYT